MPEDAIHISQSATPEPGVDLRRIDSEARQALDEWIDAINSGRVDAVCALYTHNAVLLATFDPKPLTTPSERKRYFVNFLSRKQLKAEVTEFRVTVMGDETTVANGLYNFKFVENDGIPQIIKVRFTFVYARQAEGDWLIVSHHSSRLPPPNANRI